MNVSSMFECGSEATSNLPVLTTEGILFDELRIRICHMNNKLNIIASGPAIQLAELGEQLCWIGAACRQSTTNGMRCCTPKIVSGNGQDGLTFTVSFDETSLVGEGEAIIGNGAIWHALFRNPVIVKGYPIPARDAGIAGLEIPLTVMAGQTGARDVDYFNGGIVIKSL